MNESLRNLKKLLLPDCGENIVELELTEGGAADRQDILCRLVKDKTVLHVGCVDIPNTIKAKQKEGRWLHGAICNSAKRAIGLDKNAAAVKQLRDELDIEIDAGSIESTRLSRYFVDIVLLAGVLQHVDNPFKVLEKVRCESRASFLIVTVPNVFSLSNLHRAKQNKEYISSDHKYWFTPTTICNLFVKAGFSPTKLFMCNLQHCSSVDELFMKQPMFCDTIIVEGAIT